MNNRERNALDNYITGRYGEDWLHESEIESGHAFTLGIAARKAGKDATTANPFLSRKFRQEWMAGWAEEDMAQFTESYDYKNKDGK